MKINVGSQARVVGTKKVNAQGSVAGLREFAGQDVLIVVPSETPRYSTTATDLLEQARSRAVTTGRMALKEFQSFRQRHLRTQVTGTARVLEVAPPKARPVIRKADAWVRASAAKIERRAEQLLRN